MADEPEDDPHRLDAGVNLQRKIAAERDAYKRRVAEEADALELKVKALHSFIQSAAFDGVRHDEQPLLKEQHLHMAAYLATLRRRMAFHKDL